MHSFRDFALCMSLGIGCASVARKFRASVKGIGCMLGSRVFAVLTQPRAGAPLELLPQGLEVGAAGDGGHEGVAPGGMIHQVVLELVEAVLHLAEGLSTGRVDEGVGEIRLEKGRMDRGQQGSILRTVHLSGATKSGCRASRFPFKLARRTTKYFAFCYYLTLWTSKNLFRATSFNLRLARRTSGSKS
jgi:hypothetical protein